jgi:carboxyl-terminal processing protease
MKLTFVDMIKKLSLFLAAILIFPLSVAAFDDVDRSDRNYSEIQYIQETGIFGNENFYPERKITRGEFVKYLLIASGISADELEGRSIDDFSGELRKYGINSKVDSSGSINLAGALSMAMKWYGVPAPKLFDVEKFKAKTSNLSPSAFYAPVMARAADLELINDNANPFSGLTRRDFAVMLANLELFDSKVQTTTADYPDVVMIDGNLLSNTFLTQEQYQIFEDVWNRILTEYVDKGEVSEEEMFYGALNGLVETLDDPYSVFQEPVAKEAFNDSLNNEVEGIGASVSFDEDGRLIIISPIVGSPAEEAGLLPNDIIKEINGKGTENSTLIELVSRIKGKAGTEVDLTVLRGNRTLEFTITRADVKVPGLTYEITSKNVAIIKITNFGIGIEDAFEDFMEQVDESKLNGIIIDVRNNPGGYLQAVSDLADYFLDKDEVIVRTIDSDGEEDLIKASSGAPLAGLKTIILANKGSASSSEILAAALKDNGKAKVIGETTFGKGSVQVLINYSDNSALKLTVARWLSPNGTKIDKNGVKPDVMIETSDADRQNRRDPVMSRALQEF